MSQGDINRLYFSTTKDQFHAAKRVSEEDRGENIKQIHFIGKIDTKYMPYTHSQSPLTLRTTCKYNSDYKPNLLGDSSANREYMDAVLGKGKPLSSPSFASGTEAKDSTPGHTGDNLKNALGERQWYSRALTRTTEVNRLYKETQSSAHRTHNGTMRKLPEAFLPEPKMKITGRAVDNAYVTQYSRDFKSNGKLAALDKDGELDRPVTEIDSMARRSFNMT